MTTLPTQAHVRFAQWVDWTGLTTDAVAGKIGCSQGAVSLVSNGHRTPGAVLSTAIAKATRRWPEGPIRAAEWREKKSGLTKKDLSILDALVALAMGGKRKMRKAELEALPELRRKTLALKKAS